VVRSSGSWLIIIFSFFLIYVFLSISCTRGTSEKFSSSSITETWNGARPMAILQTGEYPLWFLLTDNGPVHIESIEDAVSVSALIPWPYALHVCYLHERDNALVMIVNRDGFLKIDPDNSDLVLYRFSGGEIWRQYSSGGFVYYDDKPAALLYLDKRFADSGIQQPKPEIWSFNMESNILFPNQIPVLQYFFNDGWEANTLRYGNDGLIYYRIMKRSEVSSSVRFFRTADLAQTGEEISIEDFFNSVPKSIDISLSSLPDLPEGFFYTGVKYVGDSIFASWEEQEDYSIGAAGFMVIKKQ